MATTNSIQQTYIKELVSNLPNLDKKASEVIKSFAELVAELNKVNKLSSGTPAKEQITKLTGELNNSSVFFAKILGDELSKLHNIVNTNAASDVEPKIV